MKKENGLESALETEEISQDLEDGNKLARAKEMQLSAEQAKSFEAIKQLSIRAGRVQASKVITGFAECLTVSQIREAKELAKDAGITWGDTCELLGISRKTADQYLRLGNDLGDGFMADVRHLGVSIRVLEQARRLPEDVRQKLIAGEVVDLEEATKEQLTEAIRELAEEHAAEKAAVQKTLDKELKGREKAEQKIRKIETDLAEAREGIKALAEGLPPDEAEALEALRRGERAAVVWLVRIKNTVNVAGRDPMFRARLISSLNLVGELAQATADIITAQADGEEVDPDLLMEQVRGLNEDAAQFDGREPYAGV